jgi:hypothetical protein
MWVAGVFYILPQISGLAIVGVYSGYLFYVGVPKLMKTPADKVVAYTAVSIVVVVVVFAIVFFIGGIVGGKGGGQRVARSDIHNISGTVHIGNASVDLGRLDQISRAAQASAAAMQAQANGQTAPAGSVHALPADTLKSLLPAALPSGFARTEVRTSSAGTAGVGSSNAQGVYTRGDGRITLQVTDLAAMGALAAMGGAFNVQSDRETATGYEKVSKLDGRMTTERFDNQARSGRYSVLVADRFMVEAEGSGIVIDDLKAAVSAIGLGRLEGMAHA